MTRLPLCGPCCFEFFPQLLQRPDHVIAVLGGKHPGRQGGREPAAGAFRQPFFAKIGLDELLQKVQVFPIQHPQNVLMDRGLQPQRPGREKRNARVDRPLMPTVQANAFATAFDCLLGARKSKFAQRGAVPALVTGHQDGLQGRHETIKSQVLPHLHALLCHDASHCTKRQPAESGSSNVC